MAIRKATHVVQQQKNQKMEIDSLDYLTTSFNSVSLNHCYFVLFSIEKSTCVNVYK